MAKKFRFRLWKKRPPKTPGDRYWKQKLGPSFSELRSKYGLKLW